MTTVTLTHEFSISRVVKEQILWLEVTIDNCSRVEISYRFNHAGAVETRCRVVEIIPAKSNTLTKKDEQPELGSNVIACNEIT